MSQLVRIRSVKPLDGFRVHLTFTDGTVKAVDFAPYFRRPVFESIRMDQTVFRSMKVDQRMGTIVWPNGADIYSDVSVP